jgi:hypothetical protein
VKQKWAAALLSGEFEQDTGRRLRWESKTMPPKVKWSALGVLCELFRRETAGTWGWWLNMEGTFAFNDKGLGSLGPLYLLPDEVVRWAELTKSEVDKVFWLQNQGKSFKEIASWLEG